MLISKIFFISLKLDVIEFISIILVQNKLQNSSKMSLYELLQYLLLITLIILALFSLKQLLLNKNILSVSGVNNIL